MVKPKTHSRPKIEILGCLTLVPERRRDAIQTAGSQKLRQTEICLNRARSAKVVERKAFLENANWVYQQAQLGGIFLGGHDIKPSRQQIQALTDVFNALGWKNGLRTATKSLAADAWWNSSPTSAPTLFSNLIQHYQTDDEDKELFQLARANSGTDRLPCKRQPEDRHHQYQVNSQQPFRIRCCVHGCYHKLQRAAIIHWIAELVSIEVIDCTGLGT